MSSRKLTLRHEVLADLTSDELHSVGGASGLPCDTLDTLRCPTTGTLIFSKCNCTGYYPSLNAPCDTAAC